MVISKVGKRKRNPPPVKETRPAQELPKRPKVQAQRKFAQVCGGSATSTLPSTLISNQAAQNGTTKPETLSHEPPQELLPNTEDFLTFLCFRGTSVLPSHLDFFNTNKNNAEQPQIKPKVENTATTSTSKAIKQEDKQPEVKSEKRQSTGDVKKEPTPENFMPFAVQKSADTVVAGSRKQTVQALKKKYQDQRIAKNRAQCKTRSSTAKEAETSKMQKTKHSDNDAKNSSTLNDSNTSVRNKRKLRGNTDNNQQEDVATTQKLQETVKDSSARSQKSTDTPKPNKVGTRTTKSIGSIPSKEERKESEDDEHPVTRTTRQRSYSLPKTEPKLTKTNEKSAIQTEESSKGKKGRDSKKNTNEEEFSSDDDLPLVEKKKRKNAAQEKAKEKPKRTLKRLSNRRNQSSDSIERDRSSDRKSDASSKTSEPVSKRKSTTETRKSITKRASTSQSNAKGVDSERSGNESQENPNKTIKTNRKRRNEFTDLSQTDQSENETKTGRPMRKTKEAAAIYMELIGQKLNLSDFDDNMSVDSFPELPNVKKTEQMENELKANLEKDKRELTSTPKRNVRAKREESCSQKEEKSETVPKPTENKNEKNRKKSDVPTENKKLEKSFSDSDDEPLASKIVEKKPKSPKKQLNSTASPAPGDTSQNNKGDSKQNTPLTSVENPTNTKQQGKSTPNANSTMATPQKNMSTSTELTTQTKNTSSPAKSIDLNETEFKMPAESVKQLLSPPINVSPLKVPTVRGSLGKGKALFPKDAMMPPSTAPNSAQNISSILADLMPSKEESGKIFGIASVTLAQSSGPSDTKCTLGKCGSIHKPSLGPGVPTEAYLGDQMSNKDRRKAKVNMTHEQIQRWLSECSATADPFETDSLDDDLDLTSPPKPINYLSVPSPMRENDTSKDEASTTAKAKLSTKDSKQQANRQSTPNKTKAPPEDIDVDIDSASESGAVKNVKAPSNDKTLKKPAPNVSKSAGAVDGKKDQPKSLVGIKAQPVTNKTNVNNASIMATPEKKPIYNRRTPVYNTKKGEQSTAKPVVNTFGAFSPENEASVYSFDKEEDTIRTAVPFRRHSGKGSTHSKSNDNDSTKKKNSTPTKSQLPKKQQISLTLSPEESKKSIAVTTNSRASDTSKSKQSSPNEKDLSKAVLNIDSDGKEFDDEGHTFYIPLHGMGNAGGASDQMIQGVAVKLGTEGPEGPNQKVIMHAKLVTKSQKSANTMPIPEGMGMANIHEIVKALIANKDAVSKSVPIGPAPTRFRANDTTKPSTSAAPIEPATNQDSNLTRQNSNQSLFSQKTKTTKRARTDPTIQPNNNTAFPRYDDPAQMVEAPVFRPTEKEFQDPIEYINRIAPVAARFGLCRIITPPTFKPECKISDDMRFTAYNQYVNKMLHRWGPSVKEFNAIKKYLATQRITLNQPPLIGGMEIDLPRLYHTVQELGGLKEVIEKKKWARVAEDMCIPKLAQDRVTKLDDIYCKYLLPYETLSPTERQKLFDEVEADWAKREAKARRTADRTALTDSNTNENSDSEGDEEEDDEPGDGGSMECIVKGKSMALSAFYRVARNTMALWFKNAEPTPAEVEAEFWRHVAVRDSHVCVHSGAIDSSGWGYGFPSPGPKTKNSTCSKHPWNLKVLTNNHGSILRSIGPIVGVTVPTLHVGMLFSACCWYRDPHGLPWIEYLHTGGTKIWYSVPNEQSSNFRTAFTSLVPTHCQNKTVWLPCDTAMVPPHMLTDREVSLCRTEQEPGQFVVVFPRAYTSHICTGYSISESVYFAPQSWLETAKEDFKDIRDSCEPAMFSLEQLLFSVATDPRISVEVLETVLPMLKEVSVRETKERNEIQACGVTKSEKIVVKAKKPQTEENECDICRANLYISWVESDEDSIYCLHHAAKYLKNRRIQPKQCKLLYMYKKEEIEELINKINEKIVQQRKKVENKK